MAKRPKKRSIRGPGGATLGDDPDVRARNVAEAYKEASHLTPKERKKGRTGPVMFIEVAEAANVSEWTLWRWRRRYQTTYGWPPTMDGRA